MAKAKSTFYNMQLYEKGITKDVSNSQLHGDYVSKHKKNDIYLYKLPKFCIVFLTRIPYFYIYKGVSYVYSKFVSCKYCRRKLLKSLNLFAF